MRANIYSYEDQHRRNANDIEAERLIQARTNLTMKLRPFVYLADQNLEPAAFLERVAERLTEEAQRIRLERVAERAQERIQQRVG
jgi:hypothetical protein